MSASPPAAPKRAKLVQIAGGGSFLEHRLYSSLTDFDDILNLHGQRKHYRFGIVQAQLRDLHLLLAARAEAAGEDDAAAATLWEECMMGLVSKLAESQRQLGEVGDALEDGCEFGFNPR
ncbi:MAG: hypothetical protein Q9208_001412 [Pyrenodesmia sp. 3 TL-2023]